MACQAVVLLGADNALARLVSTALLSASSSQGLAAAVQQGRPMAVMPVIKASWNP
jgi:hypothetical protein